MPYIFASKEGQGSLSISKLELFSCSPVSVKIVGKSPRLFYAHTFIRVCLYFRDCLIQLLISLMSKWRWIHWSEVSSDRTWVARCSFLAFLSPSSLQCKENGVDGKTSILSIFCLCFWVLHLYLSAWVWLDSFGLNLWTLPLFFCLLHIWIRTWP